MDYLQPELGIPFPGSVISKLEEEARRKMSQGNARANFVSCMEIYGKLLCRCLDSLCVASKELKPSLVCNSIYASVSCFVQVLDAVCPILDGDTFGLPGGLFETRKMLSVEMNRLWPSGTAPAQYWPSETIVVLMVYAGLENGDINFGKC